MKYRGRLVLTAFFFVAFLLSGCKKVAKPPAMPYSARVVDLPADDGAKTVIQWKHYVTSSAVKYIIMRGEQPDKIDYKVVEMSAQIAIPAVDTAAENRFEGEGYYLVLTGDSTLPKVNVVKATPGNEDSLKKVGKPIIKVETKVVPLKNDALPLKYVEGEFYRVNPPQRLLNEPEYRTLDKTRLVALGDSVALENDLYSLTVVLDRSRREKDFIRKGRRILALGGENDEWTKKYGKKIVSFVTPDARYVEDYTPMQAIDADTIKPVEPGKKYYYKIIAESQDKRQIDSPILDVTVLDNPVSPVQGVSAVVDSITGEAVINWHTIDRDIKKIELYKTSMDDTARRAGVLVATLNPSWQHTKLTDIHRDDNPVFYIVTYDSMTSAKSELCSPVWTKFDVNSVSTPQGLALKDYPNDNGTKLALFWTPPTLALSFKVTDKGRSFKEMPFPIRNYYLVGGKLVRIEDPDSVPLDAQRITNYKEETPSDRFTLSIFYEIRANTFDGASFAEVEVEGLGKKFDKDEVKQVTFTGVSPGSYHIRARLLNPSGAAFKNPEATVETTIVVERQVSIPASEPDYYYEVYRSSDSKKADDFELIGSVPGSFREIDDRFDKKDKEALAKNYNYFLRTVSPDGYFVDSDILGPDSPRSNLFNTQKTNILVVTLVFFLISAYFLYHAKRGRRFYIRPIAGISHIDEALGRATEMGHPVLYVMGLADISALPTLASMTILGRVARKIAEYQSRLIVPSFDPIVMLVAQETVKSAYMDAGKPDAYNEGDIYFVTQSQFSYAAAIAGLMVREKPATNFFIGYFYAESLILAEAGASTGAIQIAGTDAVTQIPFFITACDYTLIGEELYAASAYLSQDPMQLSALKIQDTMKALFMIVVFLGTIAMSANFLWFVNLFRISVKQ